MAIILDRRSPTILEGRTKRGSTPSTAFPPGQRLGVTQAICEQNTSMLRRLPPSPQRQDNSLLRPTFFLEFRLQPLSLRSEEHTSELQSRLHLVCRLLLEKKNSL